MKRYTQCFTGDGLVAWMLQEGVVESEEDALTLGNSAWPPHSSAVLRLPLTPPSPLTLNRQLCWTARSSST